MWVSRKSFGAAVVALLVMVGIVPGAFAASEDSFLAKLNAERTSRGLNELASHFDLVDDAEAHSHRMMDRDDLHHNPNLGGVTTGWIALGENVGVGPSVNSIHNSFMNSSGHRANILGDFTHVGIGAVRESDNKLWVTVVFMKASGGPTTTSSAPSTTSAASTTSAPTTAITTTSSVPVTTVGAPVATSTTAAPPPAATPLVLQERHTAYSHILRLARLHKPWPV